MIDLEQIRTSRALALSAHTNHSVPHQGHHHCHPPHFQEILIHLEQTRYYGTIAATTVMVDCGCECVSVSVSISVSVCQCRCVACMSTSASDYESVCVYICTVYKCAVCMSMHVSVRVVVVSMVSTIYAHLLTPAPPGIHKRPTNRVPQQNPQHPKNPHHTIQLHLPKPQTQFTTKLFHIRRKNPTKQ